MTREEEIASLKAKLAARKGAPGWKKNCEALAARIAELEASE